MEINQTNSLLLILGIVEEWKIFKGILHRFCAAWGMEESLEKSFCLNNNLDDAQVNLIQEVFPLNFGSLNENFKYLGFFIKPNNYRIANLS